MRKFRKTIEFCTNSDYRREVLLSLIKRERAIDLKMQDLWSTKDIIVNRSSLDDVKKVRFVVQKAELSLLGVVPLNGFKRVWAASSKLGTGANFFTAGCRKIAGCVI